MIEAIRPSQGLANAPVTYSRPLSPNERDCVRRPGDRLFLSGLTERAQADHIRGEMLVRFKPGVDPTQQVSALAAELGLTVIAPIRSMKPGLQSTELDNLYHMRFNPEIPMATALEKLNGDSRVAYAEPNFIVRIADFVQTHPNDLDGRLWGLHNTGQNGGTADADIDAPEAWSLTTGSKDGPIIAVIDTGVAHNHKDLKDNMWVNPKEVPGDNLDNDGNGYVDDIHGYDFVNNDGDPMDDHNHGTHVAGTIAAKGNDGQGIVGVNWNARVMGLKFLSGSGSGTTADAIRAVLYANDNGAHLSNNSWGGGGYSQALRDAIAGSTLFVAAAGNDGTNTDGRPHYPSNYDLPNVISVAASDRNDRKASFSNFGKLSVDLAAPGKDIYSSVANGGYDSFSGTSMATPHVAGVAGLIMSKYPQATVEQVKARLLNGAEPVEAFASITVTGGRLNAYNSLEDDTKAPAAAQNLKVTGGSYQSVTLGWTAPGDDGLSGTANRYDVRYAELPLSEANWAQATSVSHALKPASGGSAQSLTVNGLAPSLAGKTYFVGLKAVDNVGNASPLATVEAKTAPAQVAFSDDAEQDKGNFTPEQPWGRAPSNGAQKMAWSDSPAGNYADNANTSLVSKKIDLRGSTQATLFFTHRHELETGYDFGYLEASVNAGQTWTQLKSYNGSADWAKESLDLSSFAGKEVQLRFRLKSDASVNQDGWNIDDVMVATDRKGSQATR